jgi:2-keto-4-pentenoate hydratase
VAIEDQGRIEGAARAIAAARLGKHRLGPLPEAIRPRDEVEAYAVQAALHRLLEAAGRGAVVGHKIGCTSAVMQRYLGIASPCAGGILAPTVHHPQAWLGAGGFRRLGVECEIAVRLQDDLPPGGAEHEPSSVVGAVGTVMAAIELVDDRYDDYRRFDTPTLIADDFFNAGCVLGDAVPAVPELDLARLEGRMLVNDREAGRGRGRDILGHPLAALAWLANSMNRRGSMLRAGEFILLGSIVQTVWLAPGDRVAIEIDRLGQAAVQLA